MLSAKDLLASHQHAEDQQHAHQQYIAREKRHDARRQADLDAGRLVRIRIDQDGDKPDTGLYPARVAAYVCQLLGPPQGSARNGVRHTFTTQGRLSAAYYPEKQAYLALLAPARAVVRRQERRYRACLASCPAIF